MKVFISWSGPRSRLLADALREWIHDVIQTVECFCSTDDIRAGQRWNNEVNAWLGDTDFGVLCVTPENMKSPWLNFEAGALAKRIDDDARVVPVTLGFFPSSLEEPLKQFNGVSADRAGFLKLMKSIADVANPGMDIERAFDRWWDDLERKLSEIPEAEEQVSTPEPPDVSEMFTDIMASIRGLSNDVRSAPLRTPDLYSTADVRYMAEMLANTEDLREAVARGDRNAMTFLRRHARSRRRPVTENSRTVSPKSSRTSRTEEEAEIDEAILAQEAERENADN